MKNNKEEKEEEKQGQEGEEEGDKENEEEDNGDNDDKDDDGCDGGDGVDCEDIDGRDGYGMTLPHPYLENWDVTWLLGSLRRLCLTPSLLICSVTRLSPLGISEKLGETIQLNYL